MASELIDGVAKTLNMLAGNAVDSDWAAFETPARAAVFAMRDPAAAMIEVAKNFSWNADDPAGSAEILWRLMIDAALELPATARV